jgi:Fic family protein
LVAAGNIRASTGIEGHHVSRDDAKAAVDQSDPFEATRTDWEAVSGYQEAMTFIIQLAGDPHFSYNTSLVRSIHYLMMKHDPECEPGRYRRGDIFVGEYQGPDPEVVPVLADELMDHLNNETNPSELVIRAAMAHLNLIMIHPFKDGNGRMSRALQTLVLGREGALDPRFSSIEEYLGHNTPTYYQVLADIGGNNWNPGRDTRPWIRFVLTAHHYRAHLMAWRVEEADRVWDRISELRSRARLDERNMGSLYNAAMGFRVRRADHVDYADVSERVATSDLRRLVDLGFLEAVGERRGRYYRATEGLRSLAERKRPRIPDPFGPVVVTPVP